MKVILELKDYGTPVEVSISPEGGFVAIQESENLIFLTVQALADIADAVEQHLESAAEEPLFTEEDLEAGRQAITEYVEALDKEEHE